MTFKCRFQGLLLPAFGDGEKDLPNIFRLFLYLMALAWTFLGVAVISDIFMAGIEKVTSSKKRVKDKRTGRKITVHVWNDTVANLTLMALGSSAPEILLSLIEISSDNFFLGPLGAGTIVGSAAFNLLCISAVCVLAIPDKEVRYIKEIPVYATTASCSVFAYLWLLFILVISTPDVCEAWEAALTLLFCPMLVWAAYLADRGYCGGGGRQAEQAAVPDDLNEEDLAAIEQEIRDKHGASLTQDQVIKIMQAEYLSHKSRAYYRHAAMEASLNGKRREMKSIAPPDLCVAEALATCDDIDEERRKKQCEMGFVTAKYAYPENCGQAKVVLVREGPTHCRSWVRYATREGSAKAKTDYIHAEGIITFEKEETEKSLLISIQDDVSFEENEEFYIDLSDPQCDEGSSCTASLAAIKVVTMVIIDDDVPGKLRFEQEEVEAVEDSQPTIVNINVERFDGACGEISCNYKTDSMGAVDSIDYVGTKGTLVFANNVQNMTIPVTINATGRVKEACFNVVLTDAKGCKFDEKTDGGADQCICHVRIKPKAGETRDNMLKEMKSRIVSANAIMGHRNWKQQFVDAVWDIGGGDDEDADGEDGPEGPQVAGGVSKVELFIHVASMPWKLLFAFVPPPDYCGGWACFCGALTMIAGVTAIVGDLANLVGCTLDILPETAAITFVALGTSLPDTFASKAAAIMDPYADASIGNITGSNSINVFVGIGLAWCLAAFKWEMGGDPTDDWIKKVNGLSDSVKQNVLVASKAKDGKAVFITPAGSMWFNLTVFSMNAFFALQHLCLRRKKWGGELGGPKKGFMGQYFSAVFLISQWFIYVTASVIFARVEGSALSYTDLANQG
jgi:solute carrier family 8 (sodium/calcium exchanger)